jgi:multiple sugar transport system permease protein
VGFGFAWIKFPGRNVLFVLMLATMMLPPQVTMIPQFVEFSWVGAYNTLFPLIIFSFTGAPFYIFLLRQFYLTLPRDLVDAAKIDGCGYFSIYWRIMLPLIKPALAAVAIFQFQASWNDFMQPLIYIADENITPISLGLFMFRQTNGGDWAELMAASTMMTLPIILLFFFTQRYFIQGITLTGLKG